MTAAMNYLSARDREQVSSSMSVITIVPLPHTPLLLRGEGALSLGLSSNGLQPIRRS
jgi:hypothetical protein